MDVLSAYATTFRYAVPCVIEILGLLRVIVGSTESPDTLYAQLINPAS